MSRKKIVFSATLKPIDDIRLFHKLAKSLNQNKFDIYLSGNHGGIDKGMYQGFTCYPIAVYKNQLKSRWKQLFLTLKFWQSIRPQIICIGSHELLFAAFWYKQFHNQKVKIVYDIQENYALNFISQSTINFFYKLLGIVYFKCAKTIRNALVDHVILAEKIYTTQLKIPVIIPISVVENKSILDILKKNRIKEKHDYEKEINFIISGTLSEVYGIKDNLMLMNQIKNYYPQKKITCTIIGYAQNTLTRNFILDFAFSNRAWVKIPVPIDRPVTYFMIADALYKADFALALYHENPSFSNKFPTKIYEYFSLKIPVIVYKNKNNFHELVTKNNAGMIYDSFIGITSIHFLFIHHFYNKPINNIQFDFKSVQKIFDTIN